jgi:NADH-quinone oxidoreductase subunit H
MAETFFILIKIVVIVLPLMLTVAYLTFAERKIIGYIHSSIGCSMLPPAAQGI